MRRIEKLVVKRMDDIPFIRLTDEIVKYHPSNYNERGAYTVDEWTSFSEVGKSFGETVLTEEAYMQVEDRYIDVARDILEKVGCHYLTLIILYPANRRKYVLSGKSFKTGRRLSLDDSLLVLRHALRGDIDCYLVNLSKRVQIDVGFEYYMNVHSPMDYMELQKIVSEHHLYLNPRSNIDLSRYDYHGMKTWIETLDDGGREQISSFFRGIANTLQPFDLSAIFALCTRIVSNGRKYPLRMALLIRTEEALSDMNDWIWDKLQNANLHKTEICKVKGPVPDYFGRNIQRLPAFSASSSRHVYSYKDEHGCGVVIL